MKAVGLITEYNPFHNGHLYHIQKAKELSGADYVVVIMSGDFVQRGAPAIIPKRERTAMALHNGADLVLELPVIYATASAETFAFGAVSSLHAAGIVDSLCFGSELADIPVLSFLAKLFMEEPEDYKSALKQALRKGLSYPKARGSAVKAVLSSGHLKESPDHEQVLGAIDQPNNILAIEYLKALFQLNSSIHPIALKRIVSSYHSTDLTRKISSATAIRHAIWQEQDLLQLEQQLPVTVNEILHTSYQKTFPVSEDDFSLLLHDRLLRHSADTLRIYADVSGELSNRIYKLLPDYRSFTQFCCLLKTKELTYTRISRAFIHILLNIKKETVVTAPYLRLSGFRESAAPLLSELKKQCQIPVITKTAAARKVLDAAAYHCFSHDIFASQIYRSVLMERYGTDYPNPYHQQIVRLAD